jgi:hypothetical protein
MDPIQRVGRYRASFGIAGVTSAAKCDTELGFLLTAYMVSMFISLVEHQDFRGSGLNRWRPRELALSWILGI